MMQSTQSAPDSGAGCGVRLKQAREAAGLSVHEVSSQLKMPVRVVEALESDDWTILGAPVFVRGQLRSYGRLLGVDIESQLAQSAVAPVTPSVLVSHTHTPRYRRVVEQVARRGVYIAITAAIVVPVWLATRPHLANGLSVQPLDITATAADTAGGNVAGGAPSIADGRTPLIASMASLPTQTAARPALSLKFNGKSWVQVFAADGRTLLEQGEVDAGQSRSYAAGEVSKLVLGNASAVEVQRSGNPVDLAPFSRANVARVTLSSDGSLAPVID